MELREWSGGGATCGRRVRRGVPHYVSGPHSGPRLRPWHCAARQQQSPSRGWQPLHAQNTEWWALACSCTGFPRLMQAALPAIGERGIARLHQQPASGVRNPDGLMGRCSNCCVHYVARRWPHAGFRSAQSAAAFISARLLNQAPRAWVSPLKSGCTPESEPLTRRT
jgi:hypothetical protein